jgi:hypothetical protein
MSHDTSLNSVTVVALCDVGMQEIICSINSESVRKLDLQDVRHA